LAGKVEQVGEVSGLRLLCLLADGDYQVGGYAIPCGPLSVVIPQGISGGTSDQFLGLWDTQNHKLRILNLGNNQECTAHTDLSGVTLRVLVG
jgi:hypothetical protein